VVILNFVTIVFWKFEVHFYELFAGKIRRQKIFLMCFMNNFWIFQFHQAYKDIISCPILTKTKFKTHHGCTWSWIHYNLDDEGGTTLFTIYFVDPHALGIMKKFPKSNFEMGCIVVVPFWKLTTLRNTTTKHSGTNRKL
jgi:hypothetical protein